MSNIYYNKNDYRQFLFLEKSPTKKPTDSQIIKGLMKKYGIKYAAAPIKGFTTNSYYTPPTGVELALATQDYKFTRPEFPGVNVVIRLVKGQVVPSEDIIKKALKKKYEENQKKQRKEQLDKPAAPAKPAQVSPPSQPELGTSSEAQLESHLDECEKIVIPEKGGSQEKFFKNRANYRNSFDKAVRTLNEILPDITAQEEIQFQNRILRLRARVTEYTTLGVLEKDPTKMR